MALWHSHSEALAIGSLQHASQTALLGLLLCLCGLQIMLLACSSASRILHAWLHSAYDFSAHKKVLFLSVATSTINAMAPNMRTSGLDICSMQVRLLVQSQPAVWTC